MSFDDRIREALRARAAKVEEDPGSAWQRLASMGPGARDPRSLPVASGWRRAAVFVTAFAVFAAAGGFAWIALRPMGRPGQSGQPTADPVAERIIWPERTGAQLAADQAHVDVGNDATKWLLDPKEVAARFAEDVLGWGPPNTYSVTPAVSWGPDPSSQWVKITRYAVPCPSPAPGQPATCPPPFSSETLTMTQAGTVGTGGVWSVSSVRASGLDMNLQPDDTVANGSIIDGTVNFPTTAAATKGFTAKAGLYIGTADNTCGVLRLNTLHQGDTHMIQVSVPPDTSAGTRCGSLPASFAWAATAPTALAAVEPFSGVSCVRCTGPYYYYGLTVIPILVSLPGNATATVQSHSQTPAPTDPLASVRWLPAHDLGTVDQQPTSLYNAFGSIWVTSFINGSHVARLDPNTGDVVATISVPGVPTWEFGGGGMVATGDALWVADMSNPTKRSAPVLAKINPTTNAVTTYPLPSQARSVLDVTFDGRYIDALATTSIVATKSSLGKFVVYRADPTTGAIVDSYPFTASWARTVVAEGDAIWVSERGPGSCCARLVQLAPSTHVVQMSDVYAQPQLGSGVIWTPVSASGGGSARWSGLAEVNPVTGAAQRIDLGVVVAQDLAPAPGGVWMFTHFVGAPDLARFNPISGRFDIGSHLGGRDPHDPPVALVTDGQTVWILTYRGHLLRVNVP